MIGINKVKLCSVAVAGYGFENRHCYKCGDNTNNGSMNKYQYKLYVGPYSFKIWTQYEYRCYKHDI